MMKRQDVELWGGLECTVARIGDRYRNQIAETGHQDRIGDLDAIAALGIRTLRYPILWETVAPEDPDAADWRWHDARLARLRELGLSPIAGLLHHGSGPRYTDLLDPTFPERLARHAARVAERYPWIAAYTPVNEPLTTARFSGLYGVWYPHTRDDASFLRALVNQCRAVVLCMRAIRKVNPAARLIQTEDLGKCFSTPMLAYQAAHENERRWLSFDLLTGRVDRDHPWHARFAANGISGGDLAIFQDGDAAPDVIGINHYLTSERYLDQRLRRYPREMWGGNGHHRYADVEAVRVPLPPGSTGPEPRLREAWERYGLPLAVTEVHHGCTRDEQLRWLKEVWDAAHRLRAGGADLHAVTIWSLFGAVDWNSLLTRKVGFYESGAFDARCTPPRPTALAKAAGSLARTGRFDHPALDQPGWWHRPERHYRPTHYQPAGAAAITTATPRRLLITGATGTLGRAFARICDLRGLAHRLISRHDMDVASPESVADALERHRPWAVVNTAGYVRVADAEREPDRCHRENALGAEVLARACADHGIPCVTFSSDLVFDGQLGRAYVESDPVSPACVYGASKAEAERRVAGVHAGALVVRTSAFFGPWDEHNFVFTTLRDLAAGRPVHASDEAVVSPTFVPDLVHATLDLLIDEETGVWHLANQGMVSWFELAARVARSARFDSALVVRSSGAARALTALGSERGLLLPSLDNAFDRCLQAMRP
ncbi:family 1 glycosylhydrolase [Azospirillum soli]|uniref:family 1 glycosylhydrolase n=1 Tax=Azospirillum soli TaxID=1304799 RepID=UPI001AE135B1|nr:family 1 glycosylhydrolase [Azospirillum soli]MBP2314361.1 dTDP-4-dehydrorhamnose reductase [Azospirillum soli]